MEITNTTATPKILVKKVLFNPILITAVNFSFYYL
jgi:hypothetical protein